MPEAYVKRVRVTEQVSNDIGFVGPIDVVGDDPTDMCLYINVGEYIYTPTGLSLGAWTDLADGAWYMNIGRVVLDAFDIPVEDTADFWVYAIFQPVDQRLP